MQKITRKEKKRLTIIFGIILFIGLLIIVCSIFIDDAKDVVNQFAYGMKTSNANKIVDLYKEEMIYESYDSKNEIINDYEEMFNELKEDHYIVESYHIENKYKVYEGEELKKQKDMLVEYYGIDKNTIDELRLYTINFECNDDGKKKNTKQNVIIAKIENNWYYIGSE